MPNMYDASMDLILVLQLQDTNELPKEHVYEATEDLAQTCYWPWNPFVWSYAQTQM